MSVKKKSYKYLYTLCSSFFFFSPTTYDGFDPGINVRLAWIVPCFSWSFEQLTLALTQQLLAKGHLKEESLETQQELTGRWWVLLCCKVLEYNHTTDCLDWDSTLVTPYFLQDSSKIFSKLGVCWTLSGNESIGFAKCWKRNVIAPEQSILLR